MDQITAKNKIPVYIALLCSALLLGLMALPHSQYQLLSEMSKIKAGSMVNWDVTIPALSTIFVILLLVAIFLLASVSYLSMRLYNFHFLGASLMIMSVLEAIAESVYFITGFGKKSGDVPLIQISNIIVYLLNMFFAIGMIFAFFRYIDAPYQKLKRELDVEMPKQAEWLNQEEKKEPVSDDKEQMRKEILQMVAEGKITPEEADKFLKNL